MPKVRLITSGILCPNVMSGSCLIAELGTSTLLGSEIAGSRSKIEYTQIMLAIIARAHHNCESFQEGQVLAAGNRHGILRTPQGNVNQGEYSPSATSM